MWVHLHIHAMGLLPDTYDCGLRMPWCMSGSLTRGGGGNVPGIPGACARAILGIWQEAHNPDAAWINLC